MQDGREEGVKRTPCWTRYKYKTFPSLLYHLVSENINSRKLLGFVPDLRKPETNYDLCNTANRCVVLFSYHGYAFVRVSFYVFISSN